MARRRGPLTTEQMHLENERRLTRLEVGVAVIAASEALRWLSPILGPALAQVAPLLLR